VLKYREMHDRLWHTLDIGSVFGPTFGFIHSR
jgi:hypothetical protein